MNLISAIFATDSYKASHWTQYPPGADGMFSYIEARSDRTFNKTVFFGLQAIINKYLTHPISSADVFAAMSIYERHGVPFNFEGWMKVVSRHGGYIPVRIFAVPEGSVVPTGNVLMTVESTDPELFWIASYIETLLLRVWYPTTVATKSYFAKQVLRAALEKSADDLSGLRFKLHDFGARGATCGEAAGIGGAAHLLNFAGTDTVEGLIYAMDNYSASVVPGFSIPAGEHSTYTSWGRENEAEAYRNMLKRYGGELKVFAAVSDSYDIYNAMENLWGGELRDEVIKSGSTVVIRPDSGDPLEVIPRLMDIAAAKFGCTENSKGYMVLKHIRFIWGDGINDEKEIAEILNVVMRHGYSADNIAFGMGGGLLQKVNRDTLGFAMKCSAISVNGEWRDVYKDPVTQPGKASKRGRLTLLNTPDRGYMTVTEEQRLALGYPSKHSALRLVYENGKMLRYYSFDQVRANTGAWTNLEVSASEEAAA